MIEGYNSKNATVTSLLQRYDFHFLPILNPDGYEFSFAEEKVSSHRSASKKFLAWFPPLWPFTNLYRNIMFRICQSLIVGCNIRHTECESAFPPTYIQDKKKVSLKYVYVSIHFPVVAVVTSDRRSLFYLTQNRFWRKNRRHLKDSNCTGVDLNRNWDFHWSGKKFLNTVKKQWASNLIKINRWNKSSKKHNRVVSSW